VLKKYQIKYGSVGNYIRNNFSYWNFSRFRMKFGLKFTETLGVKFT
jgi:hypothetical protein